MVVPFGWRQVGEVAALVGGLFAVLAGCDWGVRGRFAEALEAPRPGVAEAGPACGDAWLSGRFAQWRDQAVNQGSMAGDHPQLLDGMPWIAPDDQQHADRLRVLITGGWHLRHLPPDDLDGSGQEYRTAAAVWMAAWIWRQRAAGEPVESSNPEMHPPPPPPAGTSAEQALDDLDALQAATTPPDSFGGLVTALAVAGERDAAYVASARAGTVPPARWGAWMEEPPERAFAWLVAASDGERRHWVGERMARAAAADGPAHWCAQWMDDRGVPEFASVQAWVGAGNEVMETQARLGALEDRFAPPPGSMAGYWWDDAPMGRAIGEDLDAAACGTLAVVTRHRLAVLACRVVAAADRDGALPADDRGMDLAGGHDREALCYVRLGPRRFAIAVARHGRLPEYAAMWARERARVAPLTRAADADSLLDGDLVVVDRSHFPAPSATAAATATATAMAW